MNSIYELCNDSCPILVIITTSTLCNPISYLYLLERIKKNLYLLVTIIKFTIRCKVAKKKVGGLNIDILELINAQKYWLKLRIRYL